MSYIFVPQQVKTYNLEDQAWFWSPEWQAGEREASADIASANVKTFLSDGEFLDSL